MRERQDTTGYDKIRQDKTRERQDKTRERPKEEDLPLAGYSQFLRGRRPPVKIGSQFLAEVEA